MTFTRALILALIAVGLPAKAGAVEIKNPLAIYAGLDKITGRIVKFEVRIDKTVQFGTLQITPRACYTKPPDETPQTVSFLQVDEVTVDKTLKRIFSGWMFAASPGLNGIEHPVYDVWLLDCVGGKETEPDVAETPDGSGDENSASVAAPSQNPFPGSAALKPSISDPSVSSSARRSKAPVGLGRDLNPSGSSPSLSASPAAPALGPPIDVGTAPVDSPIVAPVAPPGPLSPDLQPRSDRRRAPSGSPAAGGSWPVGSNPDQGLY